MAKKHFIGKATVVGQVSTGSIDSVDGTPNTNNFTVTIGGVAVTVPGDTDVGTTATNLVAALNASDHPYFKPVTWFNLSGGDIKGAADVAGVPFVAALTVSGAGSGTVTDFADDTAASGPNFVDAADNYADGVAPVSGDEIVLEHTSVSLFWHLASLAGNYTLIIGKTYTGKIGLRADAFATTTDAETFDAGADEYRETYLKADFRSVHIGQHFGPGAASGSPRVKVHTTSVTAGTVVTVFDTAASASELAKEVVRLKTDSANVDLVVRKAPGGVGVATDVPGETSTIGGVSVLDTTSAAKVHLGPGVTVTSWDQTGGTNVLEAAATVTAVTADGGSLSLEGDYLVTTLNVNDGALVRANNAPAAGSAVTTANVDRSGVLDMTQAGVAQTVGTLNLTNGGTLNGTALVDVVTAADLDGTVTGGVTFA